MTEHFSHSSNSADRIAHRVLRYAIRFYPAEQRAWGEAILAEADAITSLNTALSWTIGGLMVAFRVFLSHLVRRPFAKNEPALLGPAQAPPPLPWKMALVCLTISAGLLFVPELRQAFSVTFSISHEILTHRDDSARWEKIGRDAESKGDAAAMAMAAIHLADPRERHSEGAMQLARQAVGKDPTLTWIYSFLAQQDKGSPSRPADADLSHELQRWDPNNALPYLALAQEAAFQYEHEPHAVDLASPAGSSDKYLSEPVLTQVHERGPQWRQWMDRAFAAPAYDDYIARRLDLDRKVTQQYAIVDPVATLAAATRMRSTNLLDLRIYSQLRLAQGHQAELAGHWEDAASEYWAVAQFGQRMRSTTQRELGEGYIADLIANALQVDAFERLSPVLGKLGRPQEASVIAASAKEQRREESAFISDRERSGAFFGSSAWLVFVWAFLACVSSLLLALALAAFLATRSSSRFVRFALSYVAPLLVASCAGLLLSYRPYALAFSTFSNNPSNGSLGPLLDFYSLFDVPGEIYYWIRGGQTLILFWWALIAAGVLFCTWLLLRAARRRPA
jgi:hypothetical protein